MKIGQKFNRLTVKEYFFYIDNHKKYTDFNTLGLYRSLLENEKLSLTDKIAVRTHAHQIFKKSFEFLQLKDPDTFIKISTLGQMLTKVQEGQLWSEVRQNQEKILKSKRIKHRNFGEHAKHNCGYENCPCNGLMIRQGSPLMESNMLFNTDKNRYWAEQKSDRRRKERKMVKQIIVENTAAE